MGAVMQWDEARFGRHDDEYGGVRAWRALDELTPKPVGHQRRRDWRTIEEIVARMDGEDASNHSAIAQAQMALKELEAQGYVEHKAVPDEPMNWRITQTGELTVEWRRLNATATKLAADLKTRDAQLTEARGRVGVLEDRVGDLEFDLAAERRRRFVIRFRKPKEEA